MSGKAGQSRELSDDEVTELENQRRYLLASLDDLDTELEAGDIDRDDYESLKDDYTRRAANVLRALEEREAAVVAKQPSAIGGRKLWAIVSVAAFVLVAGVLLARSAGFRGSNDEIAGDVRGDTRSLLFEANDLAGSGEYEDAIVRLDQLLEAQPSNAEALTYRGWYRYISDEDPAVLSEVEADLDAAVAADDTYPDARVFRAIYYLDQERFAEAQGDLVVFDETATAPIMFQLVDGQQLRERAVAGLVSEDLAANPEQAILPSDYEVSPSVMAGAARQVALGGDVAVALQIIDGVLEEEPDNTEALMGRGELLISVGQQLVATDADEGQRLTDEGIASFDLAISTSQGDPRPLLLRAQAAAALGDVESAQADLDSLGELDLTETQQQQVAELESFLGG